MSSIASPAIPEVFDVFTENKLEPYFTMELIHGFNLRQILSHLRREFVDDQSVVDSFRERFPLNRLLADWLEVCDSLSMSHRHNVVHGDVKPENIMLTSDGSVRLVDWGSAWATGIDREPTTRDDRSERKSEESRRCLGSPLYMAPEQILMDQELDHRVDIYSVGVVLYDLLTLDTLILGQTRDEVLRYVLRGRRIPSSERSLRPSVPPEVEQVCMRAVSIDRDERFESITEMAGELRSAVEVCV